MTDRQDRHPHYLIQSPLPDSVWESGINREADSPEVVFYTPQRPGPPASSPVSTVSRAVIDSVEKAPGELPIALRARNALRARRCRAAKRIRDAERDSEIRNLRSEREEWLEERRSLTARLLEANKREAELCQLRLEHEALIQANERLNHAQTNRLKNCPHCDARLDYC